MSFPIRSPYTQVAGIVLVARLIDKARLHAAGQLPEGYHIGFIDGNRTFDDRFCRFLGISYEFFYDRVQQGGSDEEILESCLEAGRRPDAEQIEVWNTFMIKRGWRDAATPGLMRNKAESGLEQRVDLLTYFDLMDAEEGRPPHQLS
jgi:gluconokinase